jgi:hypothetical protein
MSLGHLTGAGAIVKCQTINVLSSQVMAALYGHFFRYFDDEDTPRTRLCQGKTYPEDAVYNRYNEPIIRLKQSAVLVEHR